MKILLLQIFSHLVRISAAFHNISKYFKKTPPELMGESKRSFDRYRLVVLAGSSSVIAKMISAVAGVISVPMIVHHVGTEAFGLWMVVSSLVLWMQVADFGVANGLTNALAEAFGREDGDAARSYLSSALVACVIVAMVCLPILLLAYFAVPWASILNIKNPEMSMLAKDVLAVVGVAFILNIPLALAGRAFIAYQRGYVSNLSQAIGSLISLLFSWLAIRMDSGLTVLVFISAFVPVFINLCLWLLLPTLDRHLQFARSGVHWKAIKRVADSSLPMFFFQCGALLVNQLVNLTIAQVATLSAVTDYNVILRIYVFAFSLAAAISSPFYAPIREAYERGDGKWVSQALRHSLMLRTGVTFFIVLALIPFGDAVVILWIGNDVILPIGSWGWVAVGASLVLSASSSLFSEVLSSLDDIWSQIRIVFLSAATVLTVMYLIVPRIGVPGVFLAMALSTIFPIFWSVRRLNSKFGFAVHK